MYICLQETKLSHLDTDIRCEKMHVEKLLGFCVLVEFAVKGTTFPPTLCILIAGGPWCLEYGWHKKLYIPEEGCGPLGYTFVGLWAKRLWASRLGL